MLICMFALKFKKYIYYEYELLKIYNTVLFSRYESNDMTRILMGPNYIHGEYNVCAYVLIDSRFIELL